MCNTKYIETVVYKFEMITHSDFHFIITDAAIFILSFTRLILHNVDKCILSNQVLESDLRKKMTHAQEVYNQAKHTLTYFSFQKQRLEDLVSQMAERLEAVEGSLSDLTDATSPEDIGTVKVLCI